MHCMQSCTDCRGDQEGGLHSSLGHCDVAALEQPFWGGVQPGAPGLPSSELPKHSSAVCIFLRKLPAAHNPIIASQGITPSVVSVPVLAFTAPAARAAVATHQHVLSDCAVTFQRPWLRWKCTHDILQRWTTPASVPLVACHGMQEDYLTMLADESPLTVPGLYYYIFQQRFGVGAVGTFLSVLPLIACFNTTVISMLTSSRSASLLHSSFTC